MQLYKTKTSNCRILNVQAWSCIIAFMLNILTCHEFAYAFSFQSQTQTQTQPISTTMMPLRRNAFHHPFANCINSSNNGSPTITTTTTTSLRAEDQSSTSSSEKKRKREKVMSFLRKVGAVGGNKDFSTAMGVDEGPVGKNRSAVKKLEKTAAAFKWCTDEVTMSSGGGDQDDDVVVGVIDDMSEGFPVTSSGSEWAGFTDQVMGGVSQGILSRETIEGRQCNLMKGRVSLYNNGGFIQMATALSSDPAVSLTVDASAFHGVELDVYYKGDDDLEKFNVHLRNPACVRQFSSYRGTFQVSNQKGWQTVRIPFSEFVGHGPGSNQTPFETTELRRLGIVAIGKAMDVYLALAGVRFYKQE